ncbi:MAG: helix-turn-helix domain-containing protein [Pusillimonas sp.]
MEHHSFSQGRPQGHQFQIISTEDIAPAARYDFWVTDVVRSLEVDPPNARQRKDFRADITSLATATGEMHYAESDGFSAHITKHTIRNLQFDELALILVLDGQAQCAYEGGEATTVGKGGFFLLDGLRPTSLHFSRQTFVQLDLSRALLESVFPGAMPAPALINAALAKSGLAGLLRDHLQQFPRVAAGLEPFEQLALLDASESFALATISGACATAAGMTEWSAEGLFAAAQRYIKRHLASPDLTPAAVAAAIACSRSTLYRLFGDKQLTVQGYIRELRLQQFMRLLQKENGTLPIQILALRCGFYDWSNVGRMFRKRFGMSPSEARASSI